MTFPVILLLLYIIVEYAKPAPLVPFRPALILQVVLLFLMLRNMEKVVAIIKDRYFILLMILLLEMMVHGPIAANNYWALQFFLTMVSYFLFSIAFCVFLDNPAKLKLFLTGFIIIHAALALDEVLTGGSYIGGRGVMGDTNDVALAANVAIPISLFLGLSCAGMQRIFLGSATILFIVANVSTLSRGGFIGLIAIGVFYWLQSTSKIKTILILLLVGMVFVSLTTQVYKDEMLTMKEEGTEYGTGRDRIELWKLAWKIFLSNPIIGVGQGNLPWVIENYQDLTNSYWERGIGGRVTHSIYFTILPELGTVGAIIFLLMIYNLLTKYCHVLDNSIDVRFRAEEIGDLVFLRNAMRGLSISLASYLVSGIFLSVFYYPQFWNLAALMTASCMILAKEVEQERFICS